MKTAISLPDHAAERFDRIAKKHGMTRAEFYRRAAEHFAHELAGADLTAQIDDAIDDAGQPGEEMVEFRRAANARLVEASPPTRRWRGIQAMCLFRRSRPGFRRTRSSTCPSR